MGPGVGVTTTGWGVGGADTAICVAVSAEEELPSPVSDTFEPTVSAAPKTTVDEDMATGIDPFPVLNVNP
jgi:hypothetical protein